MKRKPSPTTKRATTGDIKTDLTERQLATIGAVSFAYTKLEDRITDLFSIVTGLQGQMLLEVETRINGIDGKIGIIKFGAKQLGLDTEDHRCLEEALGEGVFGLMKKYREATIHARIINAPSSIGLIFEARAKINEVLLSQKALDALYDHLIALDKELQSAASVLILAAEIKKRVPDDPERAQIEAGKAGNSSRFQDYRHRWQSLPQIPEFPAEHELHAADLEVQQERRSELLGSMPWLRQWPDHFRAPSPAWLGGMHSSDTPTPLKDEDQRKKPKG